MTHDPTNDVTVLDPRSGHRIVINTYTVAPERAQELLAALVQATNDVLRHVPGFITANFHIGIDRKTLVNYAQWRNDEALKAAAADPNVMSRIKEVAAIATSFAPVLYELRESIAAENDGFV